ncbi:MAG: OmpA family protein [Parachlamydiales bacterium]|jgi:peptidoglycan-associated lipoprotein
MKKSNLLSLTVSLGLLFFLSGCQKTSSQTWENIKTAGNYLHRGVDALVGKYDESKLLKAESDFKGPGDMQYIGLNEDDLKAEFQHSDLAVAQPRILPGEKGSPIPSLEAFDTPEGRLAELFRQVHFAKDEHFLRSPEEKAVIHQIAVYLKEHPRLYACIEGHCDERASSAYNLALGSRRANHIRSLLIKEGVNLNRLFTISYGKERPLVLGNDEDAWSQNRRCEFKLYAK